MTTKDWRKVLLTLARSGADWESGSLKDGDAIAFFETILSSLADEVEAKKDTNNYGLYDSENEKDGYNSGLEKAAQIIRSYMQKS